LSTQTLESGQIEVLARELSRIIKKERIPAKRVDWSHSRTPRPGLGTIGGKLQAIRAVVKLGNKCKQEEIAPTTQLEEQSSGEGVPAVQKTSPEDAVIVPGLSVYSPNQRKHQRSDKHTLDDAAGLSAKRRFGQSAASHVQAQEDGEKGPLTPYSDLD